MFIPCDDCEGTGYTRDSSGNLEVCGRCLALGYVEPENEMTPEQELAERKEARSTLLWFSSIYGGIFGMVIGLNFLVMFLMGVLK